MGRPRPVHALEQLDFLMPLTSQSTLVDPMRSLMNEAIEPDRAPLRRGRAHRRVPCIGRCPNAGPTVYACRDEPSSDASAAARTIAERVHGRESEFALKIFSGSTVPLPDHVKAASTGARRTR